MMTFKSLVLVVVILVAFAANVNAAPTPDAFPPSGVKNLIVFGDSYADTGSTKAKFGAGQLPYFDGRFSDGQVWTEILADTLNLRLISYAFANSTSDSDVAKGMVNNRAGSQPVLGMKQLVAQYLTEDWIATSDFGESCSTVWLNGFDYLFNNQNTGDTVIKTMLAAADSLYQAGVRCFIVSNMIDPSKLPVFNDYDQPTKDLMSGKYKEQTDALGSQIDGWKNAHSGVQLFKYDVNADFNAILDPKQNPLKLEHFSEASCISWLLTPGIPQDCGDTTKWAFYDRYHPTNVIHQYIAGQIAKLVAS